MADLFPDPQEVQVILDTQNSQPKSYYYYQMDSSSTDKERPLSGITFQGLDIISQKSKVKVKFFKQG